MFAPRFVLAAALSAALASTAAAESTLRIGLAEDPDILDPTMARTYVGRIVFASLCDKLFDIDENIKIVPQLATGYEVSSDGKEVLIKLRAGVLFHDGEKFDAAAAKFSLERHLTMKGSFRRSEIAPIDSIDVVDPLSIKLKLKAPFAPLIAALTDRAGMMVSPKAAAELGDKFGTKPVCAGPYKFVERVAQQRIVVEKFQQYWDKANVHIDKIVYQPIEDSTVRLANLRSGNLDLIERSLATDADTVKKDPNLRLASVIELGYQGLSINVGNGPRAKTPIGQEARVRRAFELALDRAAIVQVVFSGEFLAGNQWISPRHTMYQQSIPIPKRDVAAAKKLLADAGVKTPYAVEMMVPNNPETRQVAEVIQSMVKEAGFDVKIRVTEFATSLKLAEQGDFETFLIGWSGRTDPDGNLYIFDSCKGPINISKFCDPEVDKLLNESRQAIDPAKRKEVFLKIAQKTIVGGPILYLYHRKMFFAHSAKLQGFKPMPDGLVRVVGLKL
ncbi:MAG TPA: ABC transporter substrate-binding protein [Alphaproteobacteria bacterium]|jgi:peptide/nickel transport system substrate-binding protein